PEYRYPARPYASAEARHRRARAPSAGSRSFYPPAGRIPSVAARTRWGSESPVSYRRSPNTAAFRRQECRRVVGETFAPTNPDNPRCVRFRSRGHRHRRSGDGFAYIVLLPVNIIQLTRASTSIFSVPPRQVGPVADIKRAGLKLTARL